jgi:hypothetical protein
MHIFKLVIAITSWDTHNTPTSLKSQCQHLAAIRTRDDVLYTANENKKLATRRAMEVCPTACMEALGSLCNQRCLVFVVNITPNTTRSQ